MHNYIHEDIHIECKNKLESRRNHTNGKSKFLHLVCGDKEEKKSYSNN